MDVIDSLFEVFQLENSIIDNGLQLDSIDGGALDVSVESLLMEN